MAIKKKFSGTQQKGIHIFMLYIKIKAKEKKPLQTFLVIKSILKKFCGYLLLSN